MTENSLKTHKITFRPKLSSVHIYSFYTNDAVDNFTDVLDLFENFSFVYLSILIKKNKNY